MKILHIGKYHPPFMGGIENFMAELMTQQVEKGNSVSAIVHHHEKKQPFAKERKKEGNIYRVPCLGLVAYAPISPSFNYHLSRAILEEKPDVLHIHMPNLSAFWCLLNAKARKVPWVIHWHADVLGSIPDLKIKLLYPFYGIFERALLRRAKKVISTSPVYFESSKPLQAFKEKTVIIPLGLKSECNVKEFAPKLMKSANRPAIKLLMIGRLTYYKGHSVLVEALAKLKQVDKSYVLHIVGTGELQTEIQNLIIGLDLSERVQLLGKLSNEALEHELNYCDLLCLPSIERTEAFGVVLLEAMRAGKACLVSDVQGSGMSWVVQDGKTGCVVKHNDVKDLTDKLYQLMMTPKTLEEYGEAGRNRFNKLFSIESVNHEIDKVYQQLI